MNLEDEVVDTQRSIDVNFNVSGSQDVPENQVPERNRLELCHSCKRHVHEGTITCPFCDSNIEYEKQEYKRNLQSAKNLATKLEYMLKI